MRAPAAVQTLLSIRGPAGDLEAVLEEPVIEIVKRFAVVCHPHSQAGGTLANKVVHTLARTFQELGLPTLRFNFRGVGRSAGEFDHGNGETDDALAVIEWGRARWPGVPFWLAGFSFGAYVALRASARRMPGRLVTVAPPVQRFEFAPLQSPQCPWLLIQGDQDEVVDYKAVVAWAQTLSPAPDVVVLPGVGHFFHGRLHELKEAVIRHVRDGAADRR
jgi:alpha/beta superfamily hydrolase